MYVQPDDFEGLTVLDKDGVKITILGLVEDVSYVSSVGPGIFVYVENNSENNITIDTEKESVNDFMISGRFDCVVPKGKKAIDYIVFKSSELEENGIDKIEQVELIFNISSTDDFRTILDTEPITLNFK